MSSKQRDLIDRVLIHKYESWLTPEPECNRFELYSKKKVNYLKNELGSFLQTILFLASNVYVLFYWR